MVLLQAFIRVRDLRFLELIHSIEVHCSYMYAHAGVRVCMCVRVCVLKSTCVLMLFSCDVPV